MRFASNMIYIPAGYFLKGTTTKQAVKLAKKYYVDESLFRSEIPQRKVYVKAFFIDRYEVTNRQYQTFIKATGLNTPTSWEDKMHPAGQEDYPVTGVNWKDAEAFAQWSGKRLPTEEEWEKAARGTDGRLYPWGNTWMPGACRMDEAKFPGDSYGTAPVGRYSRDISSYGVFDMAGNVAEWTSTKAENIAEEADFRIVKGGSYVLSQPYNFRCVHRAAHFIDDGVVGYIGFRCATDAPESESLLAKPIIPTSKKRFSQQATNLNNKQLPILSDKQLPILRPELYLKHPIQIFPYIEGNVKYWTRKDYVSGGDCILRISVPFLPCDEFFFIVLEGIFSGIDGSSFSFSADHTIATFNWEEPKRFKVVVEYRGRIDCVDGVYRICNTSSSRQTLTVDTCFNALNAPNFRDHEGNRTFIMVNQDFVAIKNLPNQMYARTHLWPSSSRTGGHVAPLLAVVSRSQDWIISQASGQATYLFNNREYCCLHTGEEVKLDPGEEKLIIQKTYFIQGKLNNILNRWNHDFQ